MAEKTERETVWLKQWKAEGEIRSWKDTWKTAKKIIWRKEQKTRGENGKRALKMSSIDPKNFYNLISYFISGIASLKQNLDK